ncbi:MAG: hypothetical protein AB1589_38185 [Cyanobacteriota bacterium]
MLADHEDCCTVWETSQEVYRFIQFIMNALLQVSGKKIILKEARVLLAGHD